MNLSHRMLETITVKSPTGVGSSGDLTYGSASTVLARVYKKTNVVTDTNGMQLTSNYVLAVESSIPLNSRVWLPGATTSDNNQAQRVLSTEHASTLDGSYTLYLVYC